MTFRAIDPAVAKIYYAEEADRPISTLNIPDGSLVIFTDSGLEDSFDSVANAWFNREQITQTGSGKTAGLMVASEGVNDLTQRHNRSNNVISATWPSNDTFSVSWTQAENVRRYRILVTGGADGNHVRVVEDAVNEVQAEAWLAENLNNVSSDNEYLTVHTSTPDANGTFIPHWSDWQELSKATTDLSLGRLDFIASAAGPFAITVEAE